MQSFYILINRCNSYSLKLINKKITVIYFVITVFFSYPKGLYNYKYLSSECYSEVKFRLHYFTSVNDIIFTLFRILSETRSVFWPYSLSPRIHLVSFIMVPSSAKFLSAQIYPSTIVLFDSVLICSFYDRSRFHALYSSSQLFPLMTSLDHPCFGLGFQVLWLARTSSSFQRNVLRVFLQYLKSQGISLWG